FPLPFPGAAGRPPIDQRRAVRGRQRRRRRRARQVPPRHPTAAARDGARLADARQRRRLPGLHAPLAAHRGRAGRRDQSRADRDVPDRLRVGRLRLRRRRGGADVPVHPGHERPVPVRIRARRAVVRLMAVATGRRPLRLGPATALRVLAIAAYAAVALFPFLWILRTAVTPAGEAFSLTPSLVPAHVTLDHVVRVLTSPTVPFDRYFANT